MFCTNFETNQTDNRLLLLVFYYIIQITNIWIGVKTISGCIACGKCFENGKCVFNDVVNEFAAKEKGIEPPELEQITFTNFIR